MKWEDSRSSGPRISRLRDWLSSAEERVTLVSPYVTLSSLEEALRDVLSDVEVWVICSWRPNDLLSGVSSPELYTLCKERGWALSVDLGKSEFVHMKAYVRDNKTALVGSANLTESGMGNNYETLVELDFEDGPVYPSYPEVATDLMMASYSTRLVDEELYEYVKGYVSENQQDAPNIPDFTPPQQNPEEAEEEELDDWEVDEDADVQEEYTMAFLRQKDTIFRRSMDQVLEAMGDPPTIDTLYTLNSISEALDERGMRFGQIRKIVSDAIDGSDENGFPMDPIDFFGFDRRDISNEITNEVMRTISDSDERVDIQTGPRGHHTKCLVWRLDLILNSEITKHLSPHIGKTMREIGLDVDQEDQPLSGARSQQIRLTCLKLLPERLRMAVDSLTTWSATISMGENGMVKENRPVGPNILTSELPEMSRPVLLNSLWLPSFCVYQAPKGAKLGDVVLVGFGFWEAGWADRARITDEYERDIKAISENADKLESGDKSFLDTDSNRDCVFVKVRSVGGRGGHLLGSPSRPMCHYLTKGLLAKIAESIS